MIEAPQQSGSLAPPTSPAPGRPRRHLVVELAVLIALLVVVALLWARARHTWYWLDEGIALGISSQPLGSIPELLRQDASPPLFYMVLHLWTSLFGTSEGQTHLLSLLFALGTILTAFWAGRSLFGPRVGWTSAALAAVNPFIAHHANETRMYSLVVLLALVATASFLHAFVYRRRSYLPLFTLSLVLLLYTHNWGLFFGAGAGLALVLTLVVSSDRRPLLVDGAMAFAATAVLYAPWVPTLLYQRRHTGIPSAPGPTLGLVRDDLVRLVGGREVVVALGLGAGVALAGMVRRSWDDNALAVAATAAIPVVTIAAGWAASTSTSVWSFRYLAVALPPILLMGALGLGRGGRTGLVALAVIAFLTAPIEAKGPPYQKSNLRSVAARASSRLEPGDLVIAPTGEVPLLAHYLPAGLRFATTTGPVRDARVADWRDNTKRLRDSNTKAALLPLVDSVPVGGHVLVVCPPPTPELTIFVGLNFRRCDEARSLLREDSRFRQELVMRPPRGVRSAPVEGSLFARQA